MYLMKEWKPGNFSPSSSSFFLSSTLKKQFLEYYASDIVQAVCLRVCIIWMNAEENCNEIAKRKDKHKCSSITFLLIASVIHFVISTIDFLCIFPISHSQKIILQGHFTLFTFNTKALSRDSIKSVQIHQFGGGQKSK